MLDPNSYFIVCQKHYRKSEETFNWLFPFTDSARMWHRRNRVFIIIILTFESTENFCTSIKQCRRKSLTQKLNIKT